MRALNGVHFNLAQGNAGVPVQRRAVETLLATSLSLQHPKCWRERRSKLRLYKRLPEMVASSGGVLGKLRGAFTVALG
jgi:hypothetical protein